MPLHSCDLGKSHPLVAKEAFLGEVSQWRYSTAKPPKGEVSRESCSSAGVVQFLPELQEVALGKRHVPWELSSEGSHSVSEACANDRTYHAGWQRKDG